MTPIPNAPTVVIMANRHQGDQLLAIRHVCGVPLVRRHLQVVRSHEWCEVAIVVPPAERKAVAEAVGDPAALGMQVSYIESGEGTFPAPALLHMDTAQFLVLEGHYVLEGLLLTMLRAGEANALLCDSQPGEKRHLAIEVRDGLARACGEQVARPTHAYAGAVLLSREALAQVAAAGNGPWPTSLPGLVPLMAVDVRCSNLYQPEVRHRVPPFWQVVETPADAEHCKRALLSGAQKRTLDAIAWYINRPIENLLTLHVADWPITPNQVTMLTALLGFIVTGLFLAGYWLPAVLLALVVNVLDGVDGKLARVKALSTRLGQLEHSLDLLYEQSWYIAFAWATFMQRRAVLVLVVGLLMLWWDNFARHVSMQFRQVTGIPLSDYAPFDRTFRRYDGRRNIYVMYMLLGVIAGRPFYALCAMALHALLTGIVYIVRAAKHLQDADLGANDSIGHLPV